MAPPLQAGHRSPWAHIKQTMHVRAVTAPGRALGRLHSSPHQQCVHIAVPMWFGLQAEGVLGVQRQVCVAV
jgi:hypothetical protein